MPETKNISLNEAVIEIVNSDEELTLERNRKISALIEAVFKKFFAEQRIFKAVVWNQYTPHFNHDGSNSFRLTPREYSTYEDAYRIDAGEGYTVEYLKKNEAMFNSSYGKDKMGEAFRCIDDLETIFTITPDIFKSLFEDHCCVSASRKRLYVSDLQHK